MNWELCCLSHAALQCELLSSEPLHFPIPSPERMCCMRSGSAEGAAAAASRNDEEECYSFLRHRPEG